MSNYLLAFDGAGNRIQGQQGNRTPGVSFVYPRRQLRQGQFVNDDASGFPVPVGRRVATPLTPPQYVPFRIGRYYQTFPDFANTVTDPVDRHRQPPNPPPPPNSSAQIRRYYQTFPDVANTVTDPTDHPTRRAYVPAPSGATQIRRYYSPLPVAPPADDPVARYQMPRWQQPPPSIAHQIRRYYAPVIVGDIFVGDVRTRIGLVSGVDATFTTTANVYVRLGE